MILTVTLNPAVDIRYEIGEFKLNSIFRAKSNKTAGGKGLNVSRVLQTLGKNVVATGFLGGNNGQWIAEELKKLEIKNEFIKINSETRSCIAILGENSQTEILEPGSEIDEEELKKFIDFFKKNCEKFEVICLSGSLPKNIQTDIYKELSVIARKKKVLLDTSGISLKAGIEGKPFLIKPNKDELEALLGYRVKTVEEIVEAGKKLKSMGARNILISLGGEGAVYIGDESYKITIPKVQIKNPVGSGDSSIAGFAYGLSSGLPLEEILKYSMACGISNAMKVETGYVDLEVVQELFSKIIIEKI